MRRLGLALLASMLLAGCGANLVKTPDDASPPGAIDAAVVDATVVHPPPIVSDAAVSAPPDARVGPTCGEVNFADPQVGFGWCANS